VDVKVATSVKEWQGVSRCRGTTFLFFEIQCKLRRIRTLDWQLVNWLLQKFGVRGVHDVVRTGVGFDKDAREPSSLHSAKGQQFDSEISKRRENTSSRFSVAWTPSMM
jgi:hypothetical protein